MPKSTKKLLCTLLSLLVAVSAALLLTACGSDPEEEGQATVPVITDTGAGDSEQQVAALTALNALRGSTEEARLTELATQLPTCPFCGKAANWSAFQYDSEDPNRIVASDMSADANAPSHFYVYGDKTTVEGNWLIAPNKDTQHYACVLLDGNIASEGCILAFHPAIVSVGGRGSITTSSSGQGGLFAFSGSKLQHELNLYGGSFSSTGNEHLDSAVIYTKDPSSVVNIWSDDVVIGSETKPTDSTKNSYNIRCGGTLNMYGGTIQNGKASTGSSSEESGNLHLMPGSVFNMYDGIIQNGYARKGANVYISSADIDPEYYDPKNPPNWNSPLEHNLGNDPVVSIQGGTIQNGYATSNGGGIFNKSSKLSIDGLTLVNNTSVITGGNFWTNQTVEISNTLISGGESTHSHGGNIFLSSGDLILAESTTVENGKALGRAGNVYVNPSCTLTVNGKVIQTTDEVHAELGGNIYLAGSAIINGVVSGGHSSGGGGNIYVVLTKSELILGDGEISGGIDDTDPRGGNVSIVVGTLKLTGSGTIDGKVLLSNYKNAKLVVQRTFTGDVTVCKDGYKAKTGATVKYATCKGKFSGKLKDSNTGSENVSLLMKYNGGSKLKYSSSVKNTAK